MKPYIEELLQRPNYLDELMQRTYKEMEVKKERLIEMKLREKGFGHYADTLLTSRFPKVCCEKHNNWTLYFADDGSERGAFIIAIRDYSIENSCEANRISVSFSWSDVLPGEIKI